MASYDFGALVKASFAGSQASVANTNFSSSSIDTQGFEGVAVTSAVGLSTLNALADPVLTVTATFLEGDDTNISNATALPSKYVGNNPVLGTSNIAYTASVKPNKRYLFVTYVPTTTALANVTTLGVLGFPHEAPQNQ